MSFALKLGALIAIALSVANAQCMAQCVVVGCELQHDASLPPCHQQQHHHHDDSRACAQPAALDNSGPITQPLAFLAAVAPLGSITLAVQQRPRLTCGHSPPDSPPPIPFALRI